MTRAARLMGNGEDAGKAPGRRAHVLGELARRPSSMRAAVALRAGLAYDNPRDAHALLHRADLDILEERLDRDVPGARPRSRPVDRLKRLLFKNALCERIARHRERSR